MHEQQPTDRLESHNSPEQSETSNGLYVAVPLLYSFITNLALYKADITTRVGVSTGVGIAFLGAIKALENPNNNQDRSIN